MFEMNLSNHLAGSLALRPPTCAAARSGPSAGHGKAKRRRPSYIAKFNSTTRHIDDSGRKQALSFRGENSPPARGEDIQMGRRSIAPLRWNLRYGYLYSHETLRSSASLNSPSTTAHLELLDWEKKTRRRCEIPRGPSQFTHLATAIRSQLGSGQVLLRWGQYEVSSSSLNMAAIKGTFCNIGGVIEMQVNEGISKYTVLGMILPETRYVSYWWRENVLQYGSVGEVRPITEQRASASATCGLIQDVMRLHVPQNREAASPQDVATGFDHMVRGSLPSGSPFWGGFMGYDGMGGSPEGDVVDGSACFSFAFVHRSLVVDHARGMVYVQSLLPADWPWIMNVGAKLESVSCR